MAGAGEGKIMSPRQARLGKGGLRRARGFLPVGGLAGGPGFPTEPGESRGGGAAPVTYRTQSV